MVVGVLLSFKNFYFIPGLIVPPLLLKTNEALLVSFVTAVLLLKFNTPFVLLLNMALPVPDIPLILPELILIVPVLVSDVLLSPRIIAFVSAIAEPTEMIPVLVILTFAALEVVLMNAPLELGLKLIPPELRKILFPLELNVIAPELLEAGVPLAFIVPLLSKVTDELASVP